MQKVACGGGERGGGGRAWSWMEGWGEGIGGFQVQSTSSDAIRSGPRASCS